MNDPWIKTGCEGPFPPEKVEVLIWHIKFKSAILATYNPVYGWDADPYIYGCDQVSHYKMILPPE